MAAPKKLQRHYGKSRTLTIRDNLSPISDLLRLADRAVVIPQQLAPLLPLCDGTRDAGGLHAALAIRFGLRSDVNLLKELVAALDEALLLDNDRFVQAREQALAEYRQAPFRPLALAGQSYPDGAGDLRLLLDRYLGAVEVADDASRRSADSSGLVCPHIDYARGGPVYAQVWKRAADAAREADLVVLLGTDHFGDGLLTLTR